jgi:hypothetical protein
MKTFSIVVKVLLALAAIAAIVYVIVVYGEKITAWFKKTLGSLKCFCDQEVDISDGDGVVIADEKDFEG